MPREPLRFPPRRLGRCPDIAVTYYIYLKSMKDATKELIQM